MSRVRPVSTVGCWSSVAAKPALWLCLSTGLALLCPVLGAAAEVTITRNDQGAVIKIGDQLFAEYLTHSGTKPVVWPLLGPGQIALTRSYPLDPNVSGEAHDHVHQRSLWFTYGNVNGVDFWTEVPSEKVGTIAHREFVEVKSGQPGVIVTKNDWLGLDGQPMLADQRTLQFAGDDEARRIDFDIVLKASYGPVTFGDTKEGAFGVRVAHALAVDSKQGGHITNSEGKTDKAAWSARAAWVDYHGSLDGQPMGIAIMSHPSSFAYPPRWHVREYGLFAANPFGSKDFGGPEIDGVKLAAGEEITLRYRVLLHRGDEQSANLDAAFKKYSGESP
jgi:hypothetical protein